MKQLFSSLLLFAFFSLPFYSSAQGDDALENAKTKQKAGSHSEAIAAFTSIIKQHDADVQKYLQQLSDYEKIPAFERAEKGMEPPPVDINLAMPYYLRGYSYSVTGKNTDAMNNFNTAIKINPKLGAAYFQRGKLLWTTGKRDDGCIDLGMAASLKDSVAKELFEEKFCWKEAVAAYHEASSKINFNEYQPVLDLMQKAIKLCPDSANYLGMRGRAYLGLGKTELAMADFEKAISLSPKSFHAWYGRGVVNYTKGKWQEAFDDLSKAVELNDHFAPAYLYRAYACEGMDKNQSAIYDYQQVERWDPLSGLAWFKSGLLRSAMGDQVGACKDFHKATQLSYPEAMDYAEKCDKPQKKK
ncbi:MAG: tetratricopeptide repeat protein [Bacteroidetes bacterium]|nr:tetratricopeptide repeat protein [Bacteroidota bacterium]